MKNILIIPIRQRRREGLKFIKLKKCEKEESIDCYKEFFANYQTFIDDDARMHLQDLEFRQFDKDLKEKYDFDLLLYRLDLRRLKRKLYAKGKNLLSNFNIFASFQNKDSKKYLHTNILYFDNPIRQKFNSGEIKEELFFNEIISRALSYLGGRLNERKDIDGFSFDIAYTSSGFYGDREIFLEYYFNYDDAVLFSNGRLSVETLLNISTVLSFREEPEKQVPIAVSHKNTTFPRILKWKNQTDGIAENGKFIRFVPPVFTLFYPKYIESEDDDTYHNFVFYGKKDDGQYIRVQVIDLGNGIKDMEEFINKHVETCSKVIEDSIGSDIRTRYIRPIGEYKGYKAFEFEFKWSLKRSLYAIQMPLVSYGRIILRNNYAVSMFGDTKDNISEIKAIFDTLNFGF